MSQNIISPYYNTYLKTIVSLKPHELNNDIYKNIKNAVIQKHMGKCFMYYGYILKIYKIDIGQIKGGIMKPDDFSSSVLFTVSFLCKLCNPIKDSLIVARIVGIHRLMIYAQNGPLNIIINSSFINQNVFAFNQNINGFIIKGTKNILEQNSYVLVKVINKVIINNEKNIIVMGLLHSMATVDDWKQNITNEYADVATEKIVDIENII